MVLVLEIIGSTNLSHQPMLFQVCEIICLFQRFVLFPRFHRRDENAVSSVMRFGPFVDDVPIRPAWSNRFCYRKNQSDREPTDYKKTIVSPSHLPNEKEISRSTVSWQTCRSRIAMETFLNNGRTDEARCSR